MKTLAICNQKGGVGKSTTTFHLSRAAVLEGLRVLVVDLDPQGNITANISSDSLPETRVGVADALTPHGALSLHDVTVSTVWGGVDLVPTPNGDNLAGVRDRLVSLPIGGESRLAHALDAATASYDLVLIDCPPSLDKLTINALVAADGVLIVTQSKQWSATGLANLLSTVSAVQEVNHRLHVAGIVINMHEKQTISGSGWLTELQAFTETEHLPLISTPIPRAVLISDAVEASTALDEWPTNRRQARAFSDLYRTILKEALR